MKSMRNIIIFVGIIATFCILGATLYLFTATDGVYTNYDRPPVTPPLSSSETPKTSEDSADNNEDLNSLPARNADANCSATLASTETPYEKGSILVAFKSGVSYSVALQSLRANGASFPASIGPSEYAERQWIVAIVPVNGEIAAVCALRNDQNIGYASLNLMFDLRE
jgi:hypothetical protein